MEPLVDVNIAVFNHAPFLRQTLDSVLAQETDFPFRIIVGDDCSTDGSREILMEYKQKYFDKILLILHDKNLGLNSYERNGTIILKMSTAKYIALLDGDDYWTDTLKLQKQVSFLENNLEFVLCGGNSTVIYESHPDKLDYIRPHYSECMLEVLTIEDQIKYDIPFHTSTAVFRNIIKEYPAFFYTAISGDISLFTLLAEKGKIRYFNEFFSVHRKHSLGITTLNTADLERKYRRKVQLYKEMNAYFKFRYSHLYIKYIHHNLASLVLARNRSGKYKEAYKSLAELYSYAGVLDFMNFLFKNIKITLKGVFGILSKKKSSTSVNDEKVNFS